MTTSKHAYRPSLAIVLGFALAAQLLGGCATAPGPRTTPTGPDEVLDFQTGAGEAGYHVLMAEMALQRNLPLIAAREYGKAAGLSEDPDISARATRVAFDVGEYGIARAAAQRWLSLDRLAREAHRYLASLEIRAGDPEAAHPHLKELLGALAPDPADAFTPLSALLLQEPDAATAVDAMALVIGEYPLMAEGYYALAVMALRASMDDLALASASRASDLAPEWPQARMLYARALVDAGQVDDGLARAAEVAATETDIGLRLEYAILLVATGDDEAAQEQFDALLEEDPYLAGALRASGLLAMRRGNLDDAQGYFTSLLASGVQTFDAFFFLARIADERGQAARAMRLYSRVQTGDYAVGSQVRIAQILQSGGRGQEALEHLRQFAAAQPQHALDIVGAQGELLQELGRNDEALALYNEVLRSRPEEESVLYARAFLYDSMGRIDDSVRELRALVRRNPDDATALNALGYTLADRTDRLREAYRYIRRALDLEPENPAIIDSYGWVQYRRGRFEDAREYLARAYAIVPDSEIAAHLGEVLWVTGDTEAARTLLMEALARDPDSKILAEVVSRLGVQ